MVMRTATQGEVRIRIEAPPERVWSVLADLDRMGDWSPECYRVDWLDGASSPPKVGARFKGRNRYGMMRWSMTCEVREVEPGKRLAWSTMAGDRELVRWTYRIDPGADGIELIESFDVYSLPLYARIAEDYLMRDRDRRRQAAMEATLERIKTVAEQGN
jgi:uncharacterized protein YndB with AHSA1/START domain